MSFEKVCNIKPDLTDVILRTRQTAHFHFRTDTVSLSAQHRLYFTCENRMFFGWKDEQPSDKLFMLIDDALDQQHAEQDRYCLDLSCDTCKAYPKRALYKLTWPTHIGIYRFYEERDNWKLSIRACAEKLHIAADGYLRVRLERWNTEESVSPRMTARAPDETILLDIPAGSYGYQKLCKNVNIPDTTACVIVTIEGQGYSGGIWVERPELVGGGHRNYLPDFEPAVPRVENYAWFGQNLSRREWPLFHITVNGKIIHDGEVFLRIHRYAAVELPLPDGCLLNGENELTITYDGEYHDPIPVAIREIHLLEQPAQAFRIISCPEALVYGEDALILVETAQQGITLRLESSDMESVSPLTLLDCGLHVISLRPKCEKNHLRFALCYGDTRCESEILRLIRREGKQILCGSGDMIYVNHDNSVDVENYLKWFFANHLGNMITIRPRYRWCGSRFLNPDAWAFFKRLCTQMRVFYPQITDGGDLPAMQINPSPKMLEGSYFLGMQNHERDGQLFYWGYPFAETDPINEMFFDLAQRLYRESPETTEATYKPGNIAVQQGQMTLRRDIDCKPDMREAHDLSLHSLRRIRGDFPRHTGPSVMFKYFYEAGYSWLGAETMDSSTEPLLAFLRGAAKANGKTRTGAHLALQWSTFPHDTEQRYCRYLLAMYVAYMQGVTDFNTEEGWLHLESRYASFGRFSEACEKHRLQEQRFFRYVSTHSRTGDYDTPVAFLHGRYDGWNGFYVRTLWGMPQMPAGEAERSWQLLKVFYPLSAMCDKGTTVPEYVPEGYSKPQGHYSGTPHGNVDVIPVENGDYSDYRLLCFCGYNAAQVEDLDRIYRFIQNGGILLAAWPHFSTTTALADIQNRCFTFIDHPLTALLADGKPVFTDAMIGGECIRVCTNLSPAVRVLRKTDDGLALLCEAACGNGQIILLNCCAYPGNPVLSPVYAEKILSLCAKLATQRTSEIRCGEDVEYAVYRQKDGSTHYYLTPVDWYHDFAQLRKAHLRIGADWYELKLAFGTMYKIVVSGNCAAWSPDEQVEILRVEDSGITAQGVDSAVIFFASNGKITTLTADFEQTPMQTLRI